MRIRLGLGKELKTIYKRYIYILTTAQKRWGVVLFVFTIIGAIAGFVVMVGISLILHLIVQIKKTKKNLV